MDKIFILLWIVFTIYVLVLCMIAADLWSGVSKAKRNGVIRSSYGYRRTVEKIARYFNMLLALTIIDAMQITSIWYMINYEQISIPMFPFITLLGAIFISAIEVKSIYEKAEDKVKFDEVGRLAGAILTNKDDIKEVAKALGDYMKTHKIEENEIDNINDKLHSN